jgi:hypothetical protein
MKITHCSDVTVVRFSKTFAGADVDPNVQCIDPLSDAENRQRQKELVRGQLPKCLAVVGRNLLAVFALLWAEHSVHSWPGHKA